MFRQYPNQLHFFVRQVYAVIPRYYCTNKSKAVSTKKSTGDNEEVPQVELRPVFFVKNIGSTYQKWYSVLNKHPELKSLKPKDVVNTMKILRKLYFTAEDIITKPMILYSGEVSLDNRYSILKECGCEIITLSLLSKYVTFVNKNVDTLKTLGYIPRHLNVIKKLLQTFTDIQVKPNTNYVCNESIKLKILRQNILSYYLQQRLDMSTEEIEKLWKIYGRLRHKSFHSVQKMVELLLNDLKFSKKRIANNAFTLYGDVDNVRRILKEIPTISNQDIREILFRRPKVMMTSCDSLLATLQHIKSFGIGEDAVLKCIEILTLGPDTVLERLRDLNEIEEFKVLITNPRVLRLVHYQNKARLRLDYLNQLKVRCASLHILSCGSEIFVKFARDGFDRSKGRDTLVYIANVLNRSEHDVRQLLSRHPNWCYIPALQVKQCYEFLLNKNFSKNNICSNVYLLLYSTKRIGEKLQQLKTPRFLEELQINRSFMDLNNNEILALVLYLIECEFHFTGDGVWTEQLTQHMENFNNLLPDFPKSSHEKYKYGTKPT